MAGEVCARCLWTGPATSAPDGRCPVCGSPLPLARVANGPETPVALRITDVPYEADTFAAQAGADEGAPPEAVDGPSAAELASALDDDDEHISREASGGSGGRIAIPRGRWALLAVNAALLVIFLALAFSTALGWRPLVAGVANASSASPSATATTPANVIPTTGPDTLLPSPTATTTPTPNPSGSGGGLAPTATPNTPPTVAPTPRPTVGIGGN